MDEVISFLYHTLPLDSFSTLPPLFSTSTVGVVLKTRVILRGTTKLMDNHSETEP